MADIFDQLAEEEPRRQEPQGDVFDQVQAEESFGGTTPTARTPSGAPIQGITQEEFEQLAPDRRALVGQAAAQQQRFEGGVPVSPESFIRRQTDEPTFLEGASASVARAGGIALKGIAGTLEASETYDETPGQIDGHDIQGGSPYGTLAKLPGIISRGAEWVYETATGNEADIGRSLIEAADKTISAPGLQKSQELQQQDLSEKVFNPRFYVESLPEQAIYFGSQALAAAATKGRSLKTRAAAFATPTAVLEGGNAYENTRDAMLDQGATEEQADEAGSQAAFMTGAGAAALDAFPATRFLTEKVPGAEKVFSRSFVRRAADSVVGRATTGAGAEGITEAAQGALADVVEYSQTKDPDTFNNALERYGTEGFLGAIIGGGVGGAQGVQSRRVQRKTRQRMWESAVQEAAMQRAGGGVGTAEEVATGRAQQRQAGPITDPRRLLEGPASAEEQAQQVEREAEEARAEAQRQAESGRTIVVDSQGRAMSQEQADELEAAGARISEPQTDPQRLLPGAATGERGQRFTVYPEGRGVVEEGARPREPRNVATQADQDALLNKVGPSLMMERAEAVRPDQFGSFQQQVENQTIFGEKSEAESYRDLLLSRVPDLDVSVSKTLDGAAWTVSKRSPVDTVAEAFKRDASQTQQKRVRRLLDTDSLEQTSNSDVVRAMLETGTMTDSVRQIVNPQQPSVQAQEDGTTIDEFIDGTGRRRLNQAGQAIEQRAQNRKAGQPVVYLGLNNFDRARSLLDEGGAANKARDIARIVREEAGDKATVTRQSDGEFAIVWEKGQSQREARRVARRVKQRVGEEKLAPNVNLDVAAGVGVLKPQNTFQQAYKEAVSQAETQVQPAPQPDETTAVTPTAEPLGDLTGDPHAEQKRRAKLKSIQRNRNQKRAEIAAQEAKRKAAAAAAEYKQRTGRGTKEPKSIEKMDTDTAQRIANAYENMQNNPDDPRVKAQYEAFKQETLDQFNALKEAGYVFDLQPVLSVAEIYPDVASLSRDLGRNQHLSVNEDPGDMPPEHPLNEIAPGTGGWTHNQVFRAVHDVFGHAQTGNEFTILGEENAWRSHVAMYSPDARGAMTTETRGQSNWVGYGPYGPQNQEAIKKGDIGQVEFPKQKAGLLPDTYWTVRGMQPQGKTPETVVSAKEGRESRKAAIKEIREVGGDPGFVDFLEDTFTPLAFRVYDIDAMTFRHLKEMVFNAATMEERLYSQFITAMEPLHQEIGKWKSAHGQRVAAALQTDREQAKELVSEEAARAIDEAGAIFDNLRQLLIEAGIDVGYVENMWPRVVRDLKGLRSYLSQEEMGAIDRAFRSARNAKGQDLTHEEKIAIVNQYLRGRGPVDPGKVGPTHTRARSLEVVTEEMVPLYQTPTQAGMSYIRDMVKAIHRSRFFGRGEITAENLNESVGSYIENAIAEGRIAPQEQEQLQHLLNAAFVGDMARVGSGTKFLKQLAYFSYLTNFRSATLQFTDIAWSFYLNHPVDALKGIGDVLAPKGWGRRVIMEEIGIHAYGAEWDDLGTMTDLLDKNLKIHSFRRFDRFGKESIINGVKHNLRRAAANPQGGEAQKYRDRFKGMFTDEEWAQLWHDTRQGNITEQTRFIINLSVANVQPIDSTQMPVGYNHNSNLFGNSYFQSRLFWTLKSYTMSRFSRMRRDTHGEWKKGNKRQALRNLAHLWLLWSVFEIPFELLWDFLRGKDVTESVPDTVVDTMLGLVLMSRYDLNEIQEEPIAGVVNWFTGAIGGGIFTDALQDLTEGITGADPGGVYDATPGLKVVRHTPWFGDFLYYLTPLGEGYHITNAQDARRKREAMQNMRKEAQEAIRRGDTFQAHTILEIYNDNKHITGRKTNLTQRDLRRQLNRETDNPLDQGGF